MGSNIVVETFITASTSENCRIGKIYVVSDSRQNIILAISVNGYWFESFWVMSSQGLSVINFAIIQKALPTD